MGGEEQEAFCCWNLITYFGKMHPAHVRFLQQVFPSPPDPLSHKFGLSLVRMDRRSVRICGRGETENSKRAQVVQK